MMRRTALPCLAALLAAFLGALFLSPRPAAAQDIIRGLKGKGGPIEITSDRLDAYNEKKMVVFSGNVVAIQEDKTIYADTLNIIYRKAPEPRAGKKTETPGGELDRIEAVGNVRVVQLNRLVTGEKAVYYQGEQKIIVTGDPVLKEGESVIRGERVVVLLDENKGIVESSKQKRVTAVINPPAQDKDKTKKK